MARRWKWFQRPEEPIDVVVRTSYPDRAGAYGWQTRPSSSSTIREPRARNVSTRYR